jgi:hypothetical protein
MPEDRIGKLGRGVELLELVAEVRLRAEAGLPIDRRSWSDCSRRSRKTRTSAWRKP